MIQHEKRRGGFTRRLFMICAGFILVWAATASFAGADDCRVGIIDTAKVVLNSEYGRQIRDQLAAEIEDQQKRLERKRTEAEKEKEKLIKLEAAGKSAESIEKQEKVLEKTIRELKWMKEDLDKELTETDKALQTRMKKRVRLVLDQFIAATEYCVVIEKHRVAAFSDSVDITDEFIKWLDSYKE